MSERILIVDDNEVFLDYLTESLSMQGYQLRAESNASKAEAAAVAFKPDLVLLDNRMPEMSGLDVCTKLKENSATKDIPVIFLSGDSERDDKIRGLDLGGVDFIAKVADPREVLARIRTHLRIRSLSQEITAANQALREKQKKMAEAMQSAAAIQQALLPRHPLEMPDLDFAWKFAPCDEVGGDIFNFLRLPEDRVATYMVDVSGHGFPSALVTVSVSQSLHPVNGSWNPAVVLQRLDREYPFERFERYFSIVAIVIDCRKRELIYSNAGHPPPILVRADGSARMLENRGAIIGFGDFSPYEEERISLRSGDKLWLYTDGVIEVENLSGDMFGTERLLEHLRVNHNKSVGECVEDLYKRLMEFGVPGIQKDDITILGIDYQGGQYAH